MGFKDSVDNALSMARLRGRMQAEHEFYLKVAKEDKISYEEAKARCHDESQPTYTLGLKLQMYMVDAALDVRHSKDHAEYFRASLNDAERELYDKEVADDLKLRNMVANYAKDKKAMRKAKKEAKRMAKEAAKGSS